MRIQELGNETRRRGRVGGPIIKPAAWGEFREVTSARCCLGVAGTVVLDPRGFGFSLLSMCRDRGIKARRAEVGLGKEVSQISAHTVARWRARRPTVYCALPRSDTGGRGSQPSSSARRSGKNRDLTVRRLQAECGMKRHHDRQCNDTGRDVRHMHEDCVLTPTVANTCNHQCPQPPPPPPPPRKRLAFGVDLRSSGGVVASLMGE